MVTCSLHVIGTALSHGLGRLGYAIGRHPCFSLLVPLAITLVLSTGLQNLNYIDDAEFLFAPRNGQSKRERHLVDEHFPTNQSGRFSVTRLTRLCRMGRLIAVARDSGTVLRQEVFSEIADIDRAILAMTVPKDATTGRKEMLKYGDICAHWQGNCVDNAVLAFNKSMRRIESGEKILHYPITFDVDTFKVVVLPAHLGGILRNSSTGAIQSAAVVSLGYFVRAASVAEDAVGRAWERRFVALVRSAATSAAYRHINLTYFTSETLQHEMETNFQNGTPYVAVSLALMLLFSGLSCMSSDPVRSKGWLGMAGVLCTCLGVLAAFGLLIYCGVEFTGINFAVPFLALGIGIDDTFVMISCWRQTNPGHSVPSRLQETLTKAGISITITSATDFVSFWIGIITPFEAIRIFCIYIATCVLFVYLVHITMFAACIAYAGYAEKQNRHGLFCFRIKPEPDSTLMRTVHKVLCISDTDRENYIQDATQNCANNAENATFRSVAIAEIKSSSDDTVTKIEYPAIRGVAHSSAVAEISTTTTSAINVKKSNYSGSTEQSVVGNYLARKLSNFWVKIVVLVMFASYLAVAIWGLTNLRDGLDILNLCRYDSDAVHYYEQESRYFKQYRVQIVVNGNIDYSNKTVQQGLENMLESFENNSYIADKMLTESWLRYFLTFVEQSGSVFPSRESFVDQVRKFVTGNQYELDVRFAKDGKSIEATRYLIQTEDVEDARQGTRMMEELRELARRSPFNITIFNPYFVYFDQFVLVRPYTAQCVAVAAVVMLTVAVVFLPSLDASLCIALAMVSIEVGVVGFMALWGIKLDAIAMINLIMCIGFSVDFSAHVTHAFINAPITSVVQDPCTQRMRHAYVTAGMPIFQGMASTVLSLMPLALIPSYIARAFFKITFLVTVLGGLHAIFLLPVLLSLIGSGKRRSCCRVAVLCRRHRSIDGMPPLAIAARPVVAPRLSNTSGGHAATAANGDFRQTSVAISTNLESYVSSGGVGETYSGATTTTTTTTNASNEITVHIRNEKKPITVKISHQLISSDVERLDDELDVGLGTSAGEDDSGTSGLGTPRPETRGRVTRDKATQTAENAKGNCSAIVAAKRRRRLSSSNNTTTTTVVTEHLNHGYDTDIDDCD